MSELILLHTFLPNTLCSYYHPQISNHSFHFQTLVTVSEWCLFLTGYSLCGARRNKKITLSSHAKNTASEHTHWLNQVFWLNHWKQDQTCPNSDVYSWQMRLFITNHWPYRKFQVLFLLISIIYTYPSVSPSKSFISMPCLYPPFSRRPLFLSLSGPKADLTSD